MAHPTTHLPPPPSPKPLPSISTPAPAAPASTSAPPLPPSPFPTPSPSFASATTLHLHTRPCYARKYSRSTLISLLSKYRCTPFFPSLLPSTTAAQLGFACGLPLLPPFSTLEKSPIKTSGDLLTLSLLPPTPSLDADWDLIPIAPPQGIPMDRNLLQKLLQAKVIVSQPL